MEKHEAIFEDVPAEERFSLEVESQLNRLVAAPVAWTHPSQVLPRPRIAYSDLLMACRMLATRVESEEEAYRTRLEEVQEKLERAVRIETSARRRREARAKREVTLPPPTR
jgi:hypothetical protein